MATVHPLRSPPTGTLHQCNRAHPGGAYACAVRASEGILSLFLLRGGKVSGTLEDLVRRDAEGSSVMQVRRGVVVAIMAGSMACGAVGAWLFAPISGGAATNSPGASSGAGGTFH
jgi:hypothetical protein